MNTEEIIRYISQNPRKTPAIAYVQGTILSKGNKDVKVFGNGDFWILIGDFKHLEAILQEPGNTVTQSHIDISARNSAVGLSDLTKFKARIEPGAIIREMTQIGEGAVIMMGAVINIGAVIGEKTMIDMNAVIGGRALIGKNCHIGAGAVIAGVIEPPSAKPVVIRDDVLVGANAVILEGIEVGEKAIVAAGAVVIDDIPPSQVWAGVPAKFVKNTDSKTLEKSKIVEALRNL
ncbi:2,3,4,5-tetrahydropyridine-2,6-dicarboxylate N-acetyltransferase [candidate division WOR-3 bacterium]|nr:2,3,4,5-tetrahydropyridine-2,6-dicarboxylate N-acetyltransferase [candidate division WOR-3 bacterium]